MLSSSHLAEGQGDSQAIIVTAKLIKGEMHCIVVLTIWSVDF